MGREGAWEDGQKVASGEEAGHTLWSEEQRDGRPPTKGGPQASGLDGECRGWALSPHNWWAVTAAVSMTWVLREQRWQREDVASVWKSKMSCSN